MTAYQSIEIVPRNVFVIGNEGSMEWTITALAVLGAVKFAGVDVFTFDDAGLITSVRAYWERAEEQVA
jgi:hypothetical protein